jgi:hypothetical protein
MTEMVMDSTVTLDNNIYAEVADASGASSVGVAFTCGVWAHYVMTWDGSTITLYRNGSLITSGAQTHNPTSSGLPFRMAQNGNTALAGGISMNGYLDGVTFHNRALSASEVAVLYTETKTGNSDADYHWLDSSSLLFGTCHCSAVACYICIPKISTSFIGRCEFSAKLAAST